MGEPLKANKKRRPLHLENYHRNRWVNAHAHDPAIFIMRVRIGIMNPHLGIFAPLTMPMRINANIFCFLDFLTICQLKNFTKKIRLLFREVENFRENIFENFSGDTS